jgi:hypothetical protein
MTRSTRPALTRIIPADLVRDAACINAGGKAPLGTLSFFTGSPSGDAFVRAGHEG